MPGPDCTHHLVAGLTGSCAGLEALVIFAEREDRSVIASMTALVPRRIVGLSLVAMMLNK
jgi:hypothetical protein